MKTLSPKDFFLHIGVIVTLYVSVASLITLVFQIINIALPDVTQVYYYFDPYSGPIRFAIASLIVVFPTFIFLSKLLRRETDYSPEKRNSGFRRSLIYLTLFIAGAIVLGDLVAVLNSFLGGELTMRFFLKALVLGGVLGVVFSYYSYELKKTEKGKTKTIKIYEIIAIVAVLTSIIFGFYYLGSPFTQRDLSLDRQRVNDLELIQYQIVNHWQNKGALPNNLADLEDSISGFRAPSDPEAGTAYTYRVKDAFTFELCATFTKASVENASIARPREFGMEQNWEHPEGEYCFERIIDPDLYPQFPKPVI